MLVLSPQPGAGLEIGRVTVNSKLGEPLDAVVRIFLAPGEELDNSCLSVASQQDFSNPEHALLSDARLTLLGEHGPIRITTATPVTQSPMSLGLRLQCDPDRFSVRPINLYLRGYYSITSVPSKLAAIDSDLPGTTITVRPGDSVYKLSRLIYPYNETAVANLAKAIVLANPALFPDGRGRPLRVGEQLTIPDLRTVEAILSRSPPPVMTAAAPKAPTSASPTKRKAVTAEPAASAMPAVPPEPAPAAIPTRKVVIAKGKLRLQLATSLDLSRARGMTEPKRAALRRQTGTAVMTGSGADTLQQISALSSRADRIRQLQDGINARLARLEAATTSLKNAFVQTQAQGSPALAPARRPASTRKEPPRTSAAPQMKPVTKPATAPAKPAIAPRASPAETQPAEPPAWRSYGVVALLVVLAIALVLLGRKFLTRRALVKQRTRIDAMLEQARTAATPLLGEEPAIDTGGAAVGQRTGPPPAEPEDFEAADRIAGQDNEPEIFDPSKTQPLVRPMSTEPPPAASSTASASEELPADLRVEMDDAMDATRSMYSDVDRFITLGRIQNAISLLEFQIKREPTDRDSWIKLMAVYRDEGMADDFDRTYAAFRDRFGDNVAF